MEVGEITARLAPLLEGPEVELLMLFGSQATGRATAASDVDLAVLAAPGTDLEALRLAAIRRLGTDRVDLVDLRRAPPLLAMAVARTGRCLHQKTGVELARFTSLALRRYADTAKLRRAREQGLRAFLAERGLG